MSLVGETTALSPHIGAEIRGLDADSFADPALQADVRTHDWDPHTRRWQ